MGHRVAVHYTTAAPLQLTKERELIKECLFLPPNITVL